MTHTPLDQFKINLLIKIDIFGFDISLTNSALFMILSTLSILIYFWFAFKKSKIIPSRMQMSGEMIYGMINDMLDQNIGQKGLKFAPLIFTIFMFILLCNLFGMIPYGFTVTSHISITLAIASMIFTFITLLGFWLHGIRFLSLLLPTGTPIWLAPLMIIIELFTYLARPISLSLRLAANMVAGHILLKVIAGFVLSLAIYLKFLPVPFIVILIGFEVFVAILQAYIFSVLSCVYLNDAVNLH